MKETTERYFMHIFHSSPYCLYGLITLCVRDAQNIPVFQVPGPKSALIIHNWMRYATTLCLLDLDLIKLRVI